MHLCEIRPDAGFSVSVSRCLWQWVIDTDTIPTYDRSPPNETIKIPVSQHTRDVVTQDGAWASSGKVSFPPENDCLNHSYRHPRSTTLSSLWNKRWRKTYYIGKHLSVTGSIGLSLSLSLSYSFSPPPLFYIHTHIISHSLPIYSSIYLSATLSLSLSFPTLICFCFFLSHSLVRSSLCSTTKWSTVKQTPRKRLLSTLPANEIRLISGAVSEETFRLVEWKDNRLWHTCTYIHAVHARIYLLAYIYAVTYICRYVHRTRASFLRTS